MESINDLKNICQARDNDYFASLWASTHFHRPISIYLTKLLLSSHVTANQATIISLILGIVAGTLCIFPSPITWLIAGFLFFIYDLFDHSDGEIARYKKSYSILGRFGDDLAGIIVRQYLFVGVSWGIFNIFHDYRALILGTVALFSSSLFYFSNILPHQIMFETGANNQEKQKPPNKFTPKKYLNVITIMQKIGENLFGLDNLGFSLIIGAALVDLWIDPFSINLGTKEIIILNARYIYLILFALASVISSSVKIKQTISALKGNYL